jgi:hypothetical protein
MKRQFLVFTLILATFFSTPFLTLADEGMWLPQDISKLPIAKMRGKGLQLAPEEIYREDRGSLRDAVMRIGIGGGGFGTGSFVSPQGLILTNHHVAFDGIAGASTPQINHLEKGFVANSQAEEIPMKGYTISITREIKDVTNEILSVVKPGMSQDERQKAIEAKQQELTAAAKKNNELLNYNVSEMVTGLKYSLFGYEVLSDIRLVYAPPKAIGFFGGDDDNFLWPRHTGDFSFLRAYASPEGKPAAYSDKNVPYQPNKFLSVSMDGYKEGDFTMVLGHPGRTQRLRDSYSIDFQQSYFLPFTIELLESRINLLDELGKKDPALKLQVASERFSLSNTLKNFQGSQGGIKRTRVVEDKRREEVEFLRFLNNNPELRQKYGNVLPQIEELYAQYTRTFIPNSLLTNLFNNVPPLQIASLSIGRALDAEKPVAERQPIYAPERFERLRQALSNILKREPADMTRPLTELLLTRLGSLPTEQQPVFAQRLFAGQSPEARQRIAADFAQQLLNYTTLENIQKLIQSNTADIQKEAAGNPIVSFLLEATQQLDKNRKAEQTFGEKIVPLRSLYIDGINQFRKNLFYPDANGTLRFTFGEVKGYKPRDGVFYTYLTNLSGVVDKDSGKEPFDVPPVLKQLYEKRDFGPYADPQTQDVPVAFLTNNDLTGGNSGSALLNGRGELLGLVFDGNYEGLGSDYGYNAPQSRTICVDIRYILFLADKMAGAQRLFKEMDIRGKAAAAVKR